MSPDEIEKTLLEVFATLLRKPVSPEVSRSNEPSWDSLQHMQLIFAVEERFGIHFTEEQIPQLNSLRQFADHLRSHHAP